MSSFAPCTIEGCGCIAFELEPEDDGPLDLEDQLKLALDRAFPRRRRLRQAPGRLPQMPEASEVQELAERIYALLAGRSPQVQGAILADLLATFLAGHFRGGTAFMDAILNLHVEHVRKLIPVNIEILKARLKK